jgi:hypothetical protein
VPADRAFAGFATKAPLKDHTQRLYRLTDYLHWFSDPMREALIAEHFAGMPG